ncbi:competence/damage-inducible protein A [Halococcus hamelinensis]|uniref:CinA-like domain-containing protein n=1 Tax=Halococcus hamelinensis 100A6 TaxID=1132509 RepID=M0M872_9EURY|nr:competence/damage-inducible protein A [Halococcus hamelinensis]EMA40590.1 CinA-like domain-containing protein [Halococcus hamelinensis 100A6]
MEIALLTIGDEILSGDTENSNATWIAARLTERGATVARILVVPDDRELIADRVADYSAAFDAVILTGGLGGTPDDVTMDAVATAFDRPLAVNDRARADVEQRLEAVREEYPDIALDVEAEASIPEGSQPLINDPGLAPGCVIENVYVLPGVPAEMKAMFETIEDGFGGDVRSQVFYTPTPEADMIDDLSEAGERFDVAVGCYPDRAVRHNRIKLVDEDEGELDAAREWLTDRLETVPAPE